MRLGRRKGGTTKEEGVVTEIALGEKRIPGLEGRRTKLLPGSQMPGMEEKGELKSKVVGAQGIGRETRN